MVTKIYKIRLEIWVALAPKFGDQENIEISARFRTTSQPDRKYLRKATRHRQSENGVANSGHAHTGKLNSVHFGPQMAKI